MFLLLLLYSRLFSARVAVLTGMFLLLRPSAGDFSRAVATSPSLHCRRTRDSAPSEEEADSTWRQVDLGGSSQKVQREFPFHLSANINTDI